MYKREIESLLQNSNLPKSLLIYGECDYQNNFYANKIIKNWNTNQDEVLLLYYDEYNFNTAKNHLNQSSLFGGKNILHVKSDKVIPKKELDLLIALCQKSEDSFFLYQYFGDSSKAKNLSKAFGKNFVRFFKANQNEALNILQQKANEIGLDIERYTLNYLYMLHMEDLSLCVNEFEKLSLLNKKITTSDIDRLVYGLGIVGLDDFIEKLLQKQDISSTLVSLEQQSGVDEVRIINAIQNYISTLLMFYLYIKAHGRCDVKEIVGYPLPPQIAKKKSELCLKFNLKTYKSILLLLNETEFNIKKVKDLDKNSYLLSSLIKLKSFL
jgi:DNA polymerase-3 subunit delta